MPRLRLGLRVNKKIETGDLDRIRKRSWSPFYFKLNLFARGALKSAIACSRVACLRGPPCSTRCGVFSVLTPVSAANFYLLTPM
jgi:hypothetical protein